MLVGAFVTCGDDETRGSGGQGAQGGVGAQGGGGDGGSTGGGMVGGQGGGGGPNCIADGMCTPDTEDCACADCVNDAMCGACVEDGMCTIDDACTCAECLGDFTCGCMVDQMCTPFTEDCACSDCFDDPLCAGQVEDCDNGQDDNMNMLIDCDDLDFCLAEAVCAEDCGNNMDDNDNGLVDCDDGLYCENSSACASDACGGATLLVSGVATMGDTANGSVGLGGTCQASPGAKEVVYTLTPPANGFVGVTLESMADLGVHVRSDCEDLMTEIVCVDAVVGGTDEVFAFDAAAATQVTLIVDGYTPAEEGPFTITATFAVDGACIDDMICSASVGEGCQCADCAMQAICGFCNMNNMCEAADACTCDECDQDAFCTDPANCTDNGFCDQFVEGCQCADCVAVPNCL
jgi:hypothetical protein